MTNRCGSKNLHAQFISIIMHIFIPSVLIVINVSRRCRTVVLELACIFTKRFKTFQLRASVLRELYDFNLGSYPIQFRSTLKYVQSTMLFQTSLKRLQP